MSASLIHNACSGGTSRKVSFGIQFRALMSSIAAAVLVLSGCAPSESPAVEDAVNEREVIEELFGLLVQPSSLVVAGLGSYVAEGSAAEQTILEIDARLERGTTEGVFARSDLELDSILTRDTEDGELAVEELSLCFEEPEFGDTISEDYCFLFSGFLLEEGLLTDVSVAGDAVHGQLLLRYFEAIASMQPSTVLDGRRYAIPGSNADEYAFHQSLVRQADVDTGVFDFFPYEVTLERGDILIDYSQRFSDFVFDDDLLKNFSAGDSLLDGRIFLYDEEAVPIGRDASIQLLSAYFGSAGTLNIVVEIVSGDRGLYVPYDATYVPTDGRAMDEITSVVPYEMSGERTSNAYWVFAGASVGGELQLKFFNDQWREINVSVPVPGEPSKVLDRL